jgi:cysteine-rich repeat protein
VCDDHNTRFGDGCGPNCRPEPGYVCGAQGCAPVCGDGVIIAPETCDQGAADSPAHSGDGCDTACTLEADWLCQGMPSVCQKAPRCGDGTLDAPYEQCDDANRVGCDGCSATCKTEAARVCGDGAAVLCERCDDGNDVGERPASIQDPSAAWAGCNRDCSLDLATCGDGVLDVAEQCDAGAKAEGKSAWNADLNPDLDQACTTSCTVNTHGIGAPCYSTAAELDPMNPSYADFAYGVITGCGGLPPPVAGVASQACMRSIQSIIGNVYFPGGYCSLYAQGCVCDYTTDPTCDLSVDPGLCALTPKVGDISVFDERTCPAGSAYVRIDMPVFGRIVRTVTCVATCQRDADCRWHQWDETFDEWGQYYCLPNINVDLSLNPDVSACIDCRTFETVAKRDCLTLAPL